MTVFGSRRRHFREDFCGKPNETEVKTKINRIFCFEAYKNNRRSTFFSLFLKKKKFCFFLFFFFFFKGDWKGRGREKKKAELYKNFFWNWKKLFQTSPSPPPLLFRFFINITYWLHKRGKKKNLLGIKNLKLRRKRNKYLLYRIVSWLLISFSCFFFLILFLATNNCNTIIWCDCYSNCAVITAVW